MDRGLDPSIETTCTAALFATDATRFLSSEDLQAEVFGSSSLIVLCADVAEMHTVAQGIEGQLTATVHADESDVDEAGELLPLLELKAGRILFNGWPTGVEVCHAQVHGGPFPATSDSRTTSVAPGRSNASCGPSPTRMSRSHCYPARSATAIPTTGGAVSTARSPKTDPNSPHHPLEAPAMRPTSDGVLFFPVTPFTDDGEVDFDALSHHVAQGVNAGPGGIFTACGTGEFHAMENEEFSAVVRTAVEVVAGRVPVYACAGGAVAQAKRFALSAEEAGADGLLLPPYLVEVPEPGLIDYTRAVAEASDLPVIGLQPRQRAVHRGLRSRRCHDPQCCRVQGLHRQFRPGCAHRAGRDRADGPDLLFFIGLPTAETTQLAYRAFGLSGYRAIGGPLYSSATFAFAPTLRWLSTARSIPATTI